MKGNVIDQTDNVLRKGEVGNTRNRSSCMIRLRNVYEDKVCLDTVKRYAVVSVYSCMDRP